MYVCMCFVCFAFGCVCACECRKDSFGKCLKCNKRRMQQNIKLTCSCSQLMRFPVHCAYAACNDGEKRKMEAVKIKEN